MPLEGKVSAKKLAHKKLNTLSEKQQSFILALSRCNGLMRRDCVFVAEVDWMVP